ncbi:hypothetical protein CK623_02445 [Vandammella animalimorsus]|uniref:DUF1854 domain-containing protein n=1 Tax=Vandammella animalimorsus TaxID=2029117 RepID=A0A2A2ATP6_9BURK|nr:DUF1854 domain-containing protein [Vandammella animalimorsus]PAT41133.1 hypothetical protein CK623_02445 [Vandammella animalimorsus]
MTSQPPAKPSASHLRYLPAHVLVLGADTPAEQLQLDQHGQLILHLPAQAAQAALAAHVAHDGAEAPAPAAAAQPPLQQPIAVQPVPAFALSAPRQCLSLVDQQGKERAYIERLDALPQPCQQAIATALAGREFIPRITAIEAVSSFSTPSLWQVHTDRGPTALLLQSEDDIRKLDAQGQCLRITDKHSLQYQIDDIEALPKASRKLLARFI